MRVGQAAEEALHDVAAGRGPDSLICLRARQTEIAAVVGIGLEQVAVPCQEALGGPTVGLSWQEIGKKLAASVGREEHAPAVLPSKGAEPGGQKGVAEIAAAGMKSSSEEAGLHEAEAGVHRADASLEDKPAVAQSWIVGPDAPQRGAEDVVEPPNQPGAADPTVRRKYHAANTNSIRDDITGGLELSEKVRGERQAVGVQQGDPAGRGEFGEDRSN